MNRPFIAGLRHVGLCALVEREPDEELNVFEIVEAGSSPKRGGPTRRANVSFDGERAAIRAVRHSPLPDSAAST